MVASRKKHTRLYREVLLLIRMGVCIFEVTADGRPLRKRRYIFSESFAAIAMSEYSIASGDKTYAVKALELFKRMQYFLQNSRTACSQIYRYAPHERTFHHHDIDKRSFPESGKLFKTNV